MTRTAVKRNFTLYRWALRLGMAALDPASGSLGGELVTPAEFGCWEDPYPDEIQYCWQLTAALLERLRDAVRADHAELIIMQVPSYVQINAQALEDTRRTYAIPKISRPERIGEELAQVCGRLQIRYLDPANALRDRERQTGRPAYFRLDGHWNALGHEVIAEILHQAILNPAPRAYKSIDRGPFDADDDAGGNTGR